MTRQEVEDAIYASYLKAQEHQNYQDPDALKRHPEYTEELTAGLATGLVGHTVCITGSKGKGSVAVMMSAIGVALEHRTGLLTSPHIHSFNERIRFNGTPITDHDFVRTAEATIDILKPVELQVEPGTYISPMGYQAMIGLRYFREKRADLRILECGKGAQYDDVARVPHDIAVINTVFLEHTRELGATLEAIASDKSHILRKNCKYGVIGPQSGNVERIFQERASRFGTKLLFYGRDFWAEDIQFEREGMRFVYRWDASAFPEGAGGTNQVGRMEFQVPLLGEHQARNAALAIAAMMLADSKLVEKQELVRQALRGISWPGRMEVKWHHPFVLLDATINRESAKAVKTVLDRLHMHRITLVVGIPDDKDYAGVIEELRPYTTALILTGSQNPHYVFTEQQVENLKELGIHAERRPRTREALAMAKELAGESGTPIVLLGTTSVVAEYTDIFNKMGPEYS